jgi:tagaturonate reductase
MISSPKPVEIAETVNGYLERLMPVLTPAGIVLGFLLPGVFIHLRPLVTALFGIITFSGALKLKVREIGLTLRSPLPIPLVFVLIHVLMPLAALLFSSLFFKDDPDTIAGFILLYSGPTAVSGVIWVSMFRGDNALCLTLILLDTLLAPIVVPGTMSILMGTKVAMNMSGIAVSLILMVVVPTIIGVTANEVSRGKIPAHVCPCVTPLSKVCIVLVIAANTSAVAPRVRLDNPKVWAIAALCVLLAAAGYVLSKYIGLAVRLKPEKQVTFFFTVGLRNISAVTTIAVEFFPGATVLPTLLGIVFQQTIAAVMGRLLLGRPGKDP